MYTYKDFATGKIKRTRGTFAGWTQHTGLLNARYAIFRNPGGDVLVPRYLLTEETRKAIDIAEQAKHARLDVARGGLEAIVRHGIANARYGYYKHDDERSYSWGNFTGSGPTVSVLMAITPNAENTASKETLVAALIASAEVM